ncbi:class I SAM-dependent methyltransferase [Nocardioides aequoreus]|uniref:class I SAM-dependent methyltransferase n=1 Tax=Nocardioides aequoreus TaxID=397278 RepID=UPI0004C2C475|nr:class I SAM-dependent methyltransferase [Nocardioides aequoreus]
MSDHQHGHEHGHHGHGHDDEDGVEEDFFEPASWEERYAAEEQMWSGRSNPALVEEASRLTPGTALDVGCGEGGDVIWLAQQGWRVTGADFSAAGLARAARHAADAGVGERCDWWQVDARDFDAAGREFDLVTTHYLHPPDGRIVGIVGRLAGAVAPGGHLLVVGHEPSERFTQLSAARRGAMWYAEELPAGLPDGFEVVACEQRTRMHGHDGEQVEVGDSVLLARRTG